MPRNSRDSNGLEVLEMAKDIQTFLADTLWRKATVERYTSHIIMMMMIFNLSTSSLPTVRHTLFIPEKI